MLKIDFQEFISILFQEFADEFQRVMTFDFDPIPPFMIQYPELNPEISLDLHKSRLLKADSNG